MQCIFLKNNAEESIIVLWGTDLLDPKAPGRENFQVWCPLHCWCRNSSKSEKIKRRSKGIILWKINKSHVEINKICNHNFHGCCIIREKKYEYSSNLRSKNRGVFNLYFGDVAPLL